MKRLKPLERSAPKSLITTVQFTPEQVVQLDLEKHRIGASSRSEVVRLIIEAYFADEDE